MDNCQQCNAGLPAVVNFCPFCGKATKPTTITPAPQALADPAKPFEQPPLPFASIEAVGAKTAGPRPAEPRSMPAPAPPSAPSSADETAKRPKAATEFRTPYPIPPPSDSWKKVAAALLLLAVVGAGLAAWMRPWVPQPPADACADPRIGTELDEARKALGARAFGTALSKSTLALTTCAVGARADELRRIQAEARNLGLAEGRRCIKNFDRPCLDRLTTDLTVVGQDPAVKAFLADAEREAAARFDRELQDAKACIAAGDIACADRRMKAVTALRPADPVVQEVAENLEQARSAVEDGSACASLGDPTCLAEALEAVRKTSPGSKLVKVLERRLRESPPVPDPKASAPAPAPASAPTPVPAPPSPAVPTSVTSHRVQVDLRMTAANPAGPQRVSIDVRSDFTVDPAPRATPKVQEAIWVQRSDGMPILGPVIRSPVQNAGRYFGSTTLTLPAETTPGTYEAVHQVLLDNTTRSDRVDRFTVPAAPVEAADPTAELLRRLVAEGEQCRADKDCGCMKDKAVAVANIDPRSTWATSMRRLASECARAKLEIR